MTQQGAQGQELAPTKQTSGFGTEAMERSNEMATAAIAAAARAEVEAGYIMAMKHPRDEETARVKILNVCKNPEFADKAIYSKPMGGKSVEGPSIRFAEEVLRHWRNAKGIQTVVYDDDQKLIFKQTVIDLEANLSFSEDITIAKTVERHNTEGRQVIGQRRNSGGQIVSIVKATEDEVFVKKSSASSKSIRNSGLRLIPEHIISEAMDVCEQAIKDKVNKDPEAAKRAIFDAFSGLQIMPRDLEQYLGHPLTQVSPDELANLRKVYQTLKDGGSKWADYVGQKAPEQGTQAAVSFGRPKTPEKAAEPHKAQETPKEAPQAAPIEVVPIVEKAQPAPAKTTAQKNLDSVCDTIQKELGNGPGYVVIHECLKTAGYPTVLAIPDDNARRAFMAMLMERLDKIKSANK